MRLNKNRLGIVVKDYVKTDCYLEGSPFLYYYKLVIISVPFGDILRSIGCGRCSFLFFFVSKAGLVRIRGFSLGRLICGDLCHNLLCT